MALNKLMHPRNIYKKKRPDFKALAIKYPEFRKHAIQDLRGEVHLDFKNPECLRVLSWALLKEDWDIDVTLPVDRLIPTIPLRLNYLLWIEDIIGTGSETVVGIDIGTGAACVYPMLGARKNNWKFIASETDDVNYDCAVKNVQQNNLAESIKVVKVEPESSLLDMLTTNEDTYTFCMCNPPFFANNLEAWGTFSSRSEDRPEPRSVNTASPTESIFPGGEVQFARRIIEDSTALKERVRIYTTMVGKKSSIAPLKMELTRQKITNIGVTEFCQGRTMRWGLAWSFDSTVNFPKAPSKVLKESKPKPPAIYKLPHEMGSLPTLEYKVSHIGAKVMAILDELKIMYEPEKSSPEDMVIQMVARENTWSHQRRKRRKERRSEGPSPDKQAHVERPTERGEGPSPDKQAHVERPTERGEGPSPDKQPHVERPTERVEGLSEQPHGFSLPQPTRETPVSETEGTSSQRVGLALSQASSNTQPSQGCSGHVSSSSATPMDVSENGQKDEKGDEIRKEVGEDGARAAGCMGDGMESDKLDVSISEVEDYILKCTLTIKKLDGDIVLELAWIDGQTIELMHQVMQFFKNRFK